MKKKLNNKGYMLIEIILAFAIAFALLYFIMDLVIKLKNKNDDLLVKTLIYSDQTIIANELMEWVKLKEEYFNCNHLTIDNKTIKYNDNVLNVVDKYATLGTKECSNEGNKISIKIPINVKQIPNEKFDVVINYKYN